MHILWFTWKDSRHPRAGGAEVESGEMMRRLAADGHEVTVLTAGFPGGLPEEVINGCRVIRLGGRWSVYWRAFVYYRRRLDGWADVVIDEMNTLPFFAALYARGARRFLLVYQLCREVWFYQMPFPVSLVGYLLEPLYLWVLRRQEVLALSESTRNDLLRYGFRPERIHVIGAGIRIRPLEDLSGVAKRPEPTILALGSVRPMKRPDHVIRAFNLAKRRVPGLKLVVAGPAEGAYGRRVLELARRSPFAADIEFLGPVNEAQKLELLRSVHVACLASVKEGWNLVVTEAASQGTPSVAYDVDGLRDSVQDGETGLVCRRNTPEGMADGIVELLKDGGKYAKMRAAGWKWSQEINFDRVYRGFLPLIKSAVHP